MYQDVVVFPSPQLTNEEDPQETPLVAAESPPPYSSITGDNAGETINNPDVSQVLGPSALLVHREAVFVSVGAGRTEGNEAL